MVPPLPKNIKFQLGPNNKKYTAILPNGKKVHFGDKSYQQYKDQVPKNLGGGLWSKSNHLDPVRRKNYRTRHSGMLCKDKSRCIDNKYSPAWFSYYFLW